VLKPSTRSKPQAHFSPASQFGRVDVAAGKLRPVESLLFILNCSNQQQNAGTARFKERVPSDMGKPLEHRRRTAPLETPCRQQFFKFLERWIVNGAARSFQTFFGEFSNQTLKRDGIDPMGIRQPEISDSVRAFKTMAECSVQERFRVKSRTSDSIRHASYVWICFRFTAADQRKSNGGKTMAESKKCGNPACTCIPPEKETFCSPHCEALKGSVEIVCQCGHNHCGGSQSHAASTTIA